MCVKRMSSRSCLGRFSRFASPTFVKCFLCNLFQPFFGADFWLFYHGVSCCGHVWSCGEECRVGLSHEPGDTSRPEHAARVKVGLETRGGSQPARKATREAALFSSGSAL